MQTFVLLSVVVALLTTADATPLTQRSISKSDALSTHNKFRARHGVPALKWSNKLANFADASAKKCKFQHTANSPYGENIYASTGQGSSTEAVTDWYNEISMYNYAKPGFSSGTGHFTQVVWKGSTHVGCARRKCSNVALGFGSGYGANGHIVFCSYSPPGNYIGEFQQNVLRPIKGSRKKGEPLVASNNTSSERSIEEMEN